MEERKKLVLKAIVDHYIRTGQPISSKTLLEEYELRVSSATVRNDMMDLERHGLIRKQYSSAGRVPTERGYRFFVDWLIELSELARPPHQALMESYRFQRPEMGELLRQTAFLLANLSGYVGFVLSPRLEKTRLESIVFVKLDTEEVLVLIVSELGIVEHCVIHAMLSPEDLQEISSLLNEKLRGRPLQEAQAEAVRFAQDEDWYDPLVRHAFLLLRETLGRRLARQLHVEGLRHLLPRLLAEGHTVEQVCEIFQLLEDAERFGGYLEERASPEIRVLIGSENELPTLQSCSLMLMSYGFSGVLGVLGPSRMDYSKAFAITNYIGNRLKAILTLSRRELISILESEVN